MRFIVKYTPIIMTMALMLSFPAHADLISDVPFGETTNASPLQTPPPPQTAAVQESGAADTSASDDGTVLVDAPDSSGASATGTAAPVQNTASSGSAPQQTDSSIPGPQPNAGDTSGPQQGTTGVSGPQQSTDSGAGPHQTETTAAMPDQEETTASAPAQGNAPEASAAGGPVPGTSTAGSSALTAGPGGAGTSASTGLIGPGSSSGSTGSAPAASVSSSGVPGADHANDARVRVDLGFTVVSPNFSYNGFQVAEGMVVLDDGSQVTIGHDKYIRQPYFRLLREDGDWYVVAVHASRIGNYSVGAVVNELWLKKSECTVQNSIELNTTNPQRQQIVKTALSLLGKGYQYAGNGPDAYDCSGLVNAVMTNCGISISRTSYEICNAGTQVGITGLRPGDIVGRPGHVGIYIGNGNFLHAAESSCGVISDSVEVYNRGSAFSSYVNVVGD